MVRNVRKNVVDFSCSINTQNVAGHALFLLSFFAIVTYALPDSITNGSLYKKNTQIIKSLRVHAILYLK